MSVAQTVRRRWWIAPLVLALVALAILVKIITTPLQVSASVSDGDQQVARTSAIDLNFNKDMDAASVRHAFAISPSVAVTFKAISPREFQFWPKMAPNTRYQATLTNAHEASGGGQVSATITFKTEPAPTVSRVLVDSNAISDGTSGIAPKGSVELVFTQAMQAGRTAITVNDKPLPGAVQWSSDGKTATLPITLGHSHPYQLKIAQAAVNRKGDPFLKDWTFSFITRIEVPSQGASDRIGSGAPAIIQIENSVDARPQAGMQQADMIYEYISEGSIPRLSAIYWHGMPDLVGPVRSCRLITIRLVLMYHGMIYCSGANDYVLGMVWQHPNLVNDYSRGQGNVFYRSSDRYAPHNVMMHGGNASTFTASANLPAPPYDIAPKHDDPGFKGDPATQVVVDDHAAVWTYDPGSKEYLKTQDGAPFMNVGTGRVHAKTVIVENVTSYLDTNPANTFHGYHTEAYELTGTGKADIYVDGVVIHGTWYHPDPNVPAVYLDQNGEPITLPTGLTWVHVIGSTKWHSGI
ncbi:MAG TPA: DUF3048 domain-containing protein [Candidatus Limnocylindrales bacterium]|nr:DUF3048 domain-containing protein [Candidatus Limnocylindrales bacterium]